MRAKLLLQTTPLSVATIASRRAATISFLLLAGVPKAGRAAAHRIPQSAPPRCESRAQRQSPHDEGFVIHEGRMRNQP